MAAWSVWSGSFGHRICRAAAEFSLELAGAKDAHAGVSAGELRVHLESVSPNDETFAQPRVKRGCVCGRAYTYMSAIQLAEDGSH